MEHVCTSVIYRFWNGKSQYTVTYVPALCRWYVFAGESNENALADFPLSRPYMKIDHKNAKHYLEQFLEKQNA